MSDLRDVKQKLVELEKIKAERERVYNDYSVIPRPETEEELAESRREQLVDIPDKIYGLKEIEEPKAPEMDKPVLPEKKKIEGFHFNIIMMMRPVALAVVLLIQGLVGWDHIEIMTIYYVIWLFLWLFVGTRDKMEAFSFSGFWKGFVHIFNLFRLPKYYADKRKTEEFNEKVYPELVKKYEDECEEAKIKYEKDCAQYEKDMEKYHEAIELRKIERENIINEKVQETVQRKRESLRKANEEYIEKTEKLIIRIAECDEKIKEYTDIDDTILFNPDHYSSADIKELIEILERGRAASLKEAVNIKLDEDRKDNEEWHRRQEADRMARIEEQKIEAAWREAEETRRHNMEIEYEQQQRRRQEAEYQRKQLENEQKQLEYNRKQLEMESRAYQQNKYASDMDRTTAAMLCNHCRYYGGCSLRTNPPLHCARFAEKSS